MEALELHFALLKETAWYFCTKMFYDYQNCLLLSSTKIFSAVSLGYSSCLFNPFFFPAVTSGETEAVLHLTGNETACYKNASIFEVLFCVNGYYYVLVFL